ncbi:MAG: tetratricopeptide repeat protein [Pseudomonadota bacterium]
MENSPNRVIASSMKQLLEVPIIIWPIAAWRRLWVIPLLAIALQSCGIGPAADIGDAEATFTDNQFRTARIHLLNILNEDRSNVAANLLYARTMLALGDGIAAQSALDKLASSQANNPDYIALQAHADIIRGQPLKAISRLEQLPAHTYTDQIYRMLIWAHMENDSLEDDPELFAEALERYDDSADIHALIGRHAINNGDWDIARRAMETALQNDGENYEALLLKAEMQIYDADLQSAKSTYRSIASLFPDHAVPMANIAGLEIDQGRYDAAAQMIRETATQHPDFPFLQFQKARLAFAQQDYRQANDILQAMPDYIHDYPPALVLSADIAEHLGNREIAIARLERLLAIVPDDDTARDKLSSLKL